MDADVGSSSGEKRIETVVVDSGKRRSSCGYCCSSSYSSISHGVWAYSLTPEDYQELLDRGWRRSGCYVYKPDMDKTCCPQYTIRLKAANFKPSKEQEKVLKKMQRYLDGTLDPKIEKSNPKIEKSTEKSNPNTSSVPVPVPVPVPESDDKILSLLSDKINKAIILFFDGKNLPLTGQTPKPLVKKVKPQMKQKLKDVIVIGEKEVLLYTCNVSFQISAYLKKLKNENSEMISLSPSNVADELAGAISSIQENINIPNFVIKACNGHINFYSDELGVESKQNYENAPLKRICLDNTGDETMQNYVNAPQKRIHSDKLGEEAKQNYENAPQKRIYSDKSVQDLNKIYENAPQKVIHSDKSTQEPKKDYENAPVKRKTLEIRMKRSEFDPVEYALYEKYQTLVHKDKKISKDSYIRFLVDTPIKNPIPKNPNPNSPPCGFGSFHQQYLIDGKLIAVGVIDILPKCLSSKYLFWDPDFAFLSLGKFSALKEVQFVKELRGFCETFEYYYLGYYIHSCVKMRYKAKYRPSELLCPLKYEWVPYEIAKPLLDKTKYAVLSDYKNHNTQLLLSSNEIKSLGDNEDNDELMNDVNNDDEEEREFMSDMDYDDDADVVQDDSSRGDIGEVILDVHNTRVKYKDLEKLFNVRKSFVSELENQLQRFIKVVGKDLSRKIVYSLG